MFIFFVLLFISAILPTLTTFVKKRITKVIKRQYNYSNSGADGIIQVLFSTHLCRFVFIFSENYFAFFLIPNYQSQNRAIKNYFFCFNFSNIDNTSGWVGMNFTPRFNIPNTFLAFCSITFAVCSLVSIK